jgi:hypothetical protein
LFAKAISFIAPTAEKGATSIEELVGRTARVISGKITSKRIIVLNVRSIGTLSQSYVNVRCDIPFAKITKINTNRSFKNKLLGQVNISIRVNGSEHFINNANKREASRAIELLFSLLSEYTE